MNAVLPAVSVLISMPEPTERTQSTPNLGGLSLGPNQLLRAENAKRKSETDSESSLDQSIESICCSSVDCAASNAGSTAQIFTVEVALPPELVVKKEEGKLQFLLQTCIPFVLAGLGMVGAGMLFDHWSQGLFLTKVPEAITLIPALSGLKGNLEMTLASRLSTMAHLGQIDGRKEKVRAFYSNLAVDQAQAIVVSLFASLFAIAIQLGQGKTVEPSNALCLMLASTLTATVTSLVLATLMLTLTFAARSLRLNPDNISTPIAAALGDLTSLASLIFFGTHLYPVRQTMAPWLIAALALLLYSSLVWMWVASREKSTRKVLKFGWFAVLAAMCLSSVGGSVLKDAVQQFQRIGLFQPLINGVGGNLVAVQSSKISTHLFSSAKYGQLPANRLLTYLNPLRTFRGKERESLNALILLALALPGHLLFLGLILAINGGQLGQEGLMGPTFVLLYLGAALTQVALLLYICQLLCRVLWICGLNPDLNSIPLLTAMGDLFGSILLAGAFLAHSLVMQK